MTELHDSEIKEAGKIITHLTLKYSRRPDTAANLESFRNEAIDSFGKIGLKVHVSTLARPSVEIVGRTTEFDPDQQQWEVTHNVANEDKIKKFLEKGEGAV